MHSWADARLYWPDKRCIRSTADTNLSDPKRKRNHKRKIVTFVTFVTFVTLPWAAADEDIGWGSGGTVAHGRKLKRIKNLNLGLSFCLRGGAAQQRCKAA
jgi:hypothetical protein